MLLLGIEKRAARARVQLWTSLLGLSFVLASCEDQGNAGNDNLLTGGSLVVVVLIVIGIILWVRGRRG